MDIMRTGSLRFNNKTDILMKVFAREPLDIDGVITPHGQVYIIPVRCKGCRLCIEFCPKDVLQESVKSNEKGYHYPEIVDREHDQCVNCEFCTLICPEFAIFTLPINGDVR
jgi:2-oxoglutarate ferredoxin oxidoreductase subunit delta